MQDSNQPPATDKSGKIKLIARNAPAFRKSRVANPQPHLVAGNPISTRLESGIGNCFPGLECDLRNLERRFFPFLEMDMPGVRLDLAKVDMIGAQAEWKAGRISDKLHNAYRTLHAKGEWTVEEMKGHFGPLGRLHFRVEQLGTPSTGAHRLPTDPWTAVRLLTEGSNVTLVLKRQHTKTKPAKTKRVTLTAKRASYLGDDGALAEMFVPGELTQSLCSPWTHDFRDCACYYWASNHPDIAMPPLPMSLLPTPPSPTPTRTDPKWKMEVQWERANRKLGDEPPDGASIEDPAVGQMDYFDINRQWQELNFVIERREQIVPYVQHDFTAAPLANKDVLVNHLYYAAGVELAVLQEYIAAAYSFKPDEELAGELLDNVRAARAQIMQIAIGEMRHLRAVNNVLASLLGTAYRPALGVATAIPGVKPGSMNLVNPQALTPDVLQSFIEIEAPSESVDSVYAPILATLIKQNGYGNPDSIQAIRTVMAEGADHFNTFRAIQEWLRPHKFETYLRAPKMTPPPDGLAENQTLQRRYAMLLDLLYKGYQAGLPAGARDLNNARNMMVGNPHDKVAQSGGINAAAEAVSKRGYLVVFKPPVDDRFVPIKPPQ
jgi:Ferritin-like